MSDTPRMEKVYVETDSPERARAVFEEGCRLERELAEARAELADFRDATVAFRQLQGDAPGGEVQGA
jgi:hypothetical protein